MIDQITLTGMEFVGHHGCSVSERECAQKFVVDIELDLDLSEACTSDNLKDTVDYVEVFNDVKSVVCGDPCNLIEALAEKIAAKIFETDSEREEPLIDSVTVTVRKPAVPIIGAVAVTVTRTFEDYYV